VAFPGGRIFTFLDVPAAAEPGHRGMDGNGGRAVAVFLSTSKYRPFMAPTKGRKETMKRLMIVMVALFSVAGVHAADTWSIDTAHSGVNFKVRHLISKTSGNFGTFDGKIVTDFDNLEASSVEFTIDANSIDTNNADRDKHLRSEDFFNVAKFPAITFKSTKITRVNDTMFAVTGDFTMHGVTKEMMIPVEFTGSMKDPWGKTRAGFSLETTLDRKEFGIVWNKALDTGGVMLGDEVEVNIDLAVVKNE
jgi:polyisoprenoid-binding protein YceI